MVIEKGRMTEQCRRYIVKDMMGKGYKKENSFPIIVPTYTDDSDYATVRESGTVYMYCKDGKIVKYDYLYYHKEQYKITEIGIVRENHGYTMEELKEKFDLYYQNISIY